MEVSVLNEESNISGIVEKVTFANSANGFSVFELNTGSELLTCVGTIHDIKVGESLSLLGKYEIHTTFGTQFKFKSYEKNVPTTSAAILRYLSSGAIKGIGPSIAKKLVDNFGSQTLDIIETAPERLAKIKGISLTMAESFKEEYIKQIGIRELMLFLAGYDISPDEALKVYKKLGLGCVEMIKANPYFLCADELPFSFDRVDKIAFEMGFSYDFSFRIYAGVEYVLRHNLSNGHTCIPMDKLVDVSAQLLSIELESSKVAVSSMLTSGRLCIYQHNGTDYLFLPHMYKAERFAAERIKLLLGNKALVVRDIDSRIEKVQKRIGIDFDERQADAIRAVLESGFLVLTGGPGTGKTTTLNAIISVFEDIGLDIMLTAPTGRAAKRMTEVTGYEAKTVHRLLEAEFDGSGRSVFCKNQGNPLECDLLIVDEASMIDSYLFECLLAALPLGCRLVLVGDADQLPSVGAGNVLRDIIASKVVPTVELKTIFRQALESAIVTNAHKINKGEKPNLSLTDSDFFFISNENPHKTVETIADIAINRLPKAYGYSTFNDIQILCPSRKQTAGTLNLNNTLQQLINPKQEGKKEIVFPSFVLRENDKVMQIRNNYDIEWDKDDETSGKGVFNGDIGILEKIDFSIGIFTVRFDDKLAVYPMENADQLELAYAITVHKSQGSEYNCVVMPLSDMPMQLKYRNLLYTAVTRAKNLLVIVGSKDRVYEMIENNKRVKRYTALEFMLEEICI